MILYHGSNVDIQDIDLDKSKPNKDFGKGFYLSDNESQALDMANFKSNILGGKPVISKFEFNNDYLHSEDLKIRIFDNYSEEWSRFVLMNRTVTDDVQLENYDIVYGPIANDRVGAQINKLLDGNIDMQEFLNRLKYMKGITFQYYFGTDKAIKLLRKL